MPLGMPKPLSPEIRAGFLELGVPLGGHHHHHHHHHEDYSIWGSISRLKKWHNLEQTSYQKEQNLISNEEQFLGCLSKGL